MLTLVCLMASACGGMADPVSMTDRKGASTDRLNSVSLARAPLTTERHRRVAARVPGYGGLFMEGGHYVAYLKDLNRRTELFPALVAELGPAPSDINAASISVRQGDFDYAELQAWADTLTSLSRDDFVTLGVAQEKNKVRIRVSSSEALERMRSRVRQLGIADSAVMLVLGPPMQQLTTLLDSMSPHWAGQRVTFGGTANGTTTYGYGCTAGFSLTRPNDASVYFAINSHCTNFDQRMDGTVNSIYYTQGDTIADEAIDPSFTPCALASGGCRYADVALIRYRSAYQPSIGLMYQTTYAHTGGTTVADSGSRLLTTYPTFFPLYIGGDVLAWQLVAGAYVEKIGSSSGWTRGQIVDACIPAVTTGSRGLYCQYTVSMLALSGDSGSTIFVPSGQYDVYGRPIQYLVGILWGGGAGTLASFSPIDGIRTDLGSFTARCNFC
jgi:hypothetical protein